jgi:malate dehydrogenase (oxaloacetate-decarboxylating)
MSLRDDALKLHQLHKGKLETKSKVPVENIAQLSLAYTPGVAEPCKEIALDKEMVYEYTNRGNLVAVVTDGTAVLGLGDIGPEAGLRLWKANAFYLNDLQTLTHFPFC